VIEINVAGADIYLPKIKWKASHQMAFNTENSFQILSFLHINDQIGMQMELMAFLRTSIVVLVQNELLQIKNS
jgi:hypothetical protein